MAKNTRRANRRSRRNTRRSRRNMRRSTRRSSRRNMLGGFQDMAYKSPFVTNMVRY